MDNIEKLSIQIVNNLQRFLVRKNRFSIKKINMIPYINTNTTYKLFALNKKCFRTHFLL